MLKLTNGSRSPISTYLCMFLCVPPIYLAVFCFSCNISLSMYFRYSHLSFPVFSPTLSLHYLAFSQSTAPACISFRLPLSLALPVVIDALSLATLSVHLHWHDVLFCGHSSMPVVSCFWFCYLLPLTDQFLLRAICLSISTVLHYFITGSRQNVPIIMI